MNNSAERWRREEMEWWEKNALIMTYQWKLTPELNTILRKDLEDDYISYLFKPGGRLLDLGCGSGWLSLLFAQKGMSVLGIDFSREQIDAAENNKLENKIESAHFECCDLVTWDCETFKEQFDSVFVNAFLHHLPADDIEKIMEKISSVIKPGGRVYLYEPMTSASSRKTILTHFLDAVFNRSIGLLVGRLPQWLHLWTPEFQKMTNDGYTGSSPHERPLDIEWVQTNCLQSLGVSEVKCWHLYSLCFAMQAMVMKPPIQYLYFRLARLLYCIDRMILSQVDWTEFADPNRFILCSLKLEKSKL